MLIKLSIQNYILIRELEIEFHDGFTAITGETGAGKSILLGALALILGQRADSGILLDHGKKCAIEGYFSIEGYNLESFFTERDLDFDNQIILRREIAPTGKSRAFINDTPVNLSVLKELGDQLVNIHSQNSVVTLNDSDFQLSVVDSYSGIQPEVLTYRENFHQFLKLKKQLSDLVALESKTSGEMDYFNFLYEELVQSKLVAGESDEIEAQLEILNHAEEIKSNLYKANRLISGEDESILAWFSELQHLLGTIIRYNPQLKGISDRIGVNYIDIKDISSELQNIEEHVYVDPAQIEALTLRLDQLNRLMKKHKVTSTDQLIDIQNDLAIKLSQKQGLEEKIGNLSTLIATHETELIKVAERISAIRQKSIPDFTSEITSTLAKLGIPMAQFKVEILRPGSLSKDGLDRVRFLFSANKGIDVKDLSNTASGGELSRIMLAVKSMISQKNLLPTIIFDEIDNGVSGDVAGKVGDILKKMGQNMQVLAITHLPQIAAKGNHHYHVYKTDLESIASTSIRKLETSDRVSEIARMLSNEVVTQSALQTAIELLRS